MKDTCCATQGNSPNTREATEKTIRRLVALGRALSDPIRVRMLGLMAAGRSCCSFPEMGVPADEEDGCGICVCEFMAYYDLGQSKVSYHLAKLKEAGLIREERRGKWNFYSLDKETIRGLLTDLAGQLDA